MIKVVKNKENLSKCNCPNCPSYNQCAREKFESLYCSSDVDRSDCNFKMAGCVCGVCSVHRENDLDSGYYCMKSSAEISQQ